MGAKVRFVRLANNFTSNVAAPTQQEIPQAEASAQPTEEHASTADDTQAAEENANSRADDCIPTAEEIARATTSVVPEENEEVRQLHQLRLKKLNQIPLLLLRLHQLQSFHLHPCEDDQGCRACSSEEKEGINFIRFFSPEEDEAID